MQHQHCVTKNGKGLRPTFDAVDGFRDFACRSRAHQLKLQAGGARGTFCFSQLKRLICGIGRVPEQGGMRKARDNSFEQLNLLADNIDRQAGRAGDMSGGKTG